MSRKEFTMDMSRSRQELKKLMNEQTRLLNIFIASWPLVKGIVYQVEVKCGKVRCRCRNEEQRHKAWKIARSHQGINQTRCVALKDLHKYKKMARCYREFRKARERFVKITKEQIELINALEIGRRIEKVWEKKR
jgi:hypothetical protein